MKLYNTLSRTVDEITALDSEKLRIYSCGPTVYDHIHIGNLSSFIFADTLRRTISVSGTKVEHVMNFTDVDDKTIARSHEKHPELEPKEALLKLTEKYSHVFLEDMNAVGNDTEAIKFVKATENILEMQSLVTNLVSKGFAYIADDGVYFSIEAYRKSGKTYGQLTDITASSTSEARIQNDEYDKESAHDFALWKKKNKNEPSWDFELDGITMDGRPGWHLECSAMSKAALGQPFDIHTGGVDLIFPHHENEIAQSTATTDDPMFAKYFAHNEHLLIDGKKMSKSLDNFYTLKDITDKGFDPLAFRLLVLQAHYRHQAHFSWENLEAAQNRLNGWHAIAALRWQAIDQELGDEHGTYVIIDGDAVSPLFDDLNTPLALANISERFTEFSGRLVSKEHVQAFEEYLTTVDEVLGVNLLGVHDITYDQKQLLEAREQAREAKDWVKADEIREQLINDRIGLRDTEYGAIWFPL